MKPRSFFLGLGLIVFASCPALHSQELDIKNIKFTQQKDSKVVVTYDLQGEPSKKYTINLYLLTSGSEEEIPLAPQHLVGDAGKAIQPGRGKKVVWNLLAEHPKGLNGENYVFAVEAVLQKGSKTTLYAAGGALMAGAGYVVYKLIDDGKKIPELPGAEELQWPPPKN